MQHSNKLLGQEYVKERLKPSLRKFYGRYGDLTQQYVVYLFRMLHDIMDDEQILCHLPLIRHYTNFWPLLIWTLLPNLTFYLIVGGFYITFATGSACQQRTLTPPDTWSCPILGFANDILLKPLTLKHTLHHQFTTVSLICLHTEFDIIEYRFLWGICNGCSMLTWYTYSSGQLVLSHFGTCMCSHVETNLS